MYRRWSIVALLILFCATANVYSGHFRGGIIMVRPKPGGEAKEVNYALANYCAIQVSVIAVYINA